MFQASTYVLLEISSYFSKNVTQKRRSCSTALHELYFLLFLTMKRLTNLKQKMFHILLKALNWEHIISRQECMASWGTPISATFIAKFAEIFRISHLDEPLDP